MFVGCYHHCKKVVASNSPAALLTLLGRCLNLSTRLDRIRSVLPINGDWRGQLNYLKVCLHFQGGLANAYKPKDDDLENEFVGDVRQVVRRVVNPFWLIKEVSGYWEDCMIVSPQSMRDRIKQKLRLLSAEYDMNIAD